MVKIMERISQAVAEYAVESPALPINISFSKVFEWTFFVASVIKSIKDRKFSSGFALLLSVSLIGKGFFKRKRRRPPEILTDLPSCKDVSPYSKALSCLAPSVKFSGKCVYGEGQVQSPKALKISPSEKKAYFEELVDVIRQIDSKAAKGIVKEIKDKMRAIETSDVVVEDAEAYCLPYRWISYFNN